MADYDHAKAFQEAFGAYDARWFLQKAERELSRYKGASTEPERIDYLLNFANTIISLEDWTLPEEEDGAKWRGNLRSESLAHGLIALIALVAKHREVGDKRFSKLRLVNGEIQAWTEEATPENLIEFLTRTFPRSKVKGVQTRIEDDEIVGYVVIIDDGGLGLKGKSVDELMNEAITFWQKRLLLTCPPFLVPT